MWFGGGGGGMTHFPAPSHLPVTLHLVPAASSVKSHVPSVGSQVAIMHGPTFGCAPQCVPSAFAPDSSLSVGAPLPQPTTAAITNVVNAKRRLLKIARMD